MIHVMSIINNAIFVDKNKIFVMDTSDKRNDKKYAVFLTDGMHIKQND